MKIFVKAKPGAKQERVERVDATHFVVRVKARAKAGAANRAIERALAEYFEAPVASVRIVRGHSGREKIVELQTALPRGSRQRRARAIESASCKGRHAGVLYVIV